MEHDSCGSWRVPSFILLQNNRLPLSPCPKPRDSNIPQLRNIPEFIVGSLLRFKVYSVIKGYWSLWEPLQQLSRCGLRVRIAIMTSRPGNFGGILSEGGCFTICCLPGRPKTSMDSTRLKVSWRFKANVLSELVGFQP